jgi:hypothetical protein
LLFANDVVGQFDVAFTLPPRSRLEIAGNRGTILVPDPWICADPRIELTREGTIEALYASAAARQPVALAEVGR